MEIYKKEIIDEILLLEPSLSKDRKKLENLLDHIIKIKPNVNISTEFKDSLKEKLLQELNLRTDLYKVKKFNNLKIFLSFILWWVTTFSLVWILWINLNFIKLDKVIDDIPVWIEQIQVNEGIGLQRTKSKNVEIWLMKMDADTSIDGSVEMEDSMIMEVNMAMDAEIFTEKTDLFIELEAYLETLGLNTEVINKILDIIRKYN